MRYPILIKDTARTLTVSAGRDSTLLIFQPKIIFERYSPDQPYLLHLAAKRLGRCSQEWLRAVIRACIEKTNYPIPEQLCALKPLWVNCYLFLHAFK